MNNVRVKSIGDIDFTEAFSFVFAASFYRVSNYDNYYSLYTYDRRHRDRYYYYFAVEVTSKGGTRRAVGNLIIV